MCVQATRAVVPTRKRTRPRANLSLYLLLSLILGLLSTCRHIILQNCYAYADKCYESVTVLSPFVHIGSPANGKLTLNVVPSPTVLSTAICPLCRTMILFTIDSPRPLPSTDLVLSFSTRYIFSKM